jgi:hypothetical protein
MSGVRDVIDNIALAYRCGATLASPPALNVGKASGQPRPHARERTPDSKR